MCGWYSWEDFLGGFAFPGGDPKRGFIALYDAILRTVQDTVNRNFGFFNGFY